MNRIQEIPINIALSLARFGHNTGNEQINELFLRISKKIGIYPKELAGNRSENLPKSDMEIRRKT